MRIESRRVFVPPPGLGRPPGVMRDRGGMAIVVVLVGLAVTSAALAAVVPWLDGLVDAERARNAADAAALAGVTGGRAAAASLAARHGAVVVSYVEHGDTVTVTVAYDDATAVARATDGP